MRKEEKIAEEHALFLAQWTYFVAKANFLHGWKHKENEDIK